MDYLNIGLLVISVITFYLFFLLPQKKDKLKEKEFFNNLKKGDEIVLKNGLCGRFLHFDNDKIVIEINSGLRLEFLKESIYVSKSLEISANNVKK